MKLRIQMVSFGNSYDSRDYFFFADLPTNKIDWSVDDFGGLFAEFSGSFVTSLEMSVHPFWTSGPGTNSKSPKLNFKSNPALSFDIGIFGGCVNILGLDWRNIYFRWGWCFQKSMLWKISDVYLVFKHVFSIHIFLRRLMLHYIYQNISQLYRDSNCNRSCTNWLYWLLWLIISAFICWIHIVFGKSLIDFLGIWKKTWHSYISCIINPDSVIIYYIVSNIKLGFRQLCRKSNTNDSTFSRTW